MIVAQLLASPFFGGPERQALGLCQHLPNEIESHFYSYAENGKAQDFLSRAASAGFATTMLQENWPHLLRCRRELADHLIRIDADILCTHGYKPDILGILAARAAGIPAISIAHGWTSATRKVRINEWVDKRAMRYFDCVIGVSEAQAARVRHSGVQSKRVVAIHNAIDLNELRTRNAEDRQRLEQFFQFKPERIVVAAGRLSPEKGFDVLIDAAQRVIQGDKYAGVVIFGAGPLEESLQSKISGLEIQRQVVLGGFRNDLDRLLPQADLFVLSSRTEGLPVILLEALGAGVPSVATPVGGVPEVIEDGINGLIAKVDDPVSLANQITELLTNTSLRNTVIATAKSRVARDFSHSLQAQRFVALLDKVACSRR